MFNLVFKISKCFLDRPVILNENASIDFLNKLERDSFTIITSPSAWKTFSDTIKIDSRNLIINPSLEIEELNKIYLKISTKWIIGIGGGRIMDTTKYFGWKLKKKVKVCLIPTITSTTSWLNMGIAVRDKNKLLMPGDRHANKVIVDPEVISKSPAELSIGGIADLVASASAVSDWKLANRVNGEKIPKKAIEAYKNYVNDAISEVDKLKPFTNQSVRYIYDKFLEALSLCGASMSGRPMEGGEHFLYYCIDELDDRFWNHGKIIALTSLICLKLHGDNAFITPEVLKAYYSKIGIKFKMQDQGLSRETLKKAIEMMPEFTLSNKFYYTIWNDPKLFETNNIEDLLDWIENL